jgi:hypothetical protein
MLSTVGVNLDLGHILRVTLWFRASRSAICAPAATTAAVACQVVRTGARMTGGIILLPALLNDSLGDLLVGERL